MAAPQNYLSTTESLLTAAQHAILCGAVGRLTDSMFPPVQDGKSDLQLAAEVAGQFAASYLTATELLRALMPPSDGYSPPIGDGIAVYFLLQQQPSLRAKVDDLANRSEAALRRLLNGPEAQVDLDNQTASQDKPIAPK